MHVKFYAQGLQKESTTPVMSHLRQVDSCIHPESHVQGTVLSDGKHKILLLSHLLIEFQVKTWGHTQQTRGPLHPSISACEAVRRRKLTAGSPSHCQYSFMAAPDPMWSGTLQKFGNTERRGKGEEGRKSPTLTASLLVTAHTPQLYPEDAFLLQGGDDVILKGYQTHFPCLLSHSKK